MKQTAIGFALGIIATLAVAALIGFLFITNGWIPTHADEAPSSFEKWAAHTALRAARKRELTGAPASPIKADKDNLMAGAKLYAQDCFACHGSPLVQSPSLAKGMIPGPPLFGKGETVTDDPEQETCCTVDRGIKWTAMPAFHSVLSEKERWQVTAFLKNMDKLPPPVAQYWNSMK